MLDCLLDALLLTATTAVCIWILWLNNRDRKKDRLFEIIKRAESYIEVGSYSCSAISLASDNNHKLCNAYREFLKRKYPSLGHSFTGSARPLERLSLDTDYKQLRINLIWEFYEEEVSK